MHTLKFSRDKKPDFSKTHGLYNRFLILYETLMYLKILWPSYSKFQPREKKLWIFEVLEIIFHYSENFQNFQKKFSRFTRSNTTPQNMIKVFCCHVMYMATRTVFRIPPNLGPKKKKIISLQWKGRDQSYWYHKLGSYKGFKWWPCYRQITFCRARLSVIESFTPC